MQKQAPSLGRILTMVLFALSCFGLLLFLWLSFGGAIPLKPKGYQFKVAVPEATQLGLEADVRVAGVRVGKVRQKQLDPNGNRTLATVEVDPRYAPIKRDARAMLRQKTLLGETYMDLTPGTKSAPNLPEGGTLANSQVVPSVELDEIYNALDEQTRQAFRSWQQDLAVSFRGHGQNISDVFGNLPQFADSGTRLLRLLNSEHSSIQRLFSEGGNVFAALTRDESALRNVILNSAQVFRATAEVNDRLAETFQVFPVFLDESRVTLSRLRTFSLNTRPLIRDLRPVARDLRPTLADLRALAPDLKATFESIDPLIEVSRTGLPALNETLREARPLLAANGAFLEQLNPILSWLELYQHQVADFLMGVPQGTADTVPTGNPNEVGHYLRQSGPIGIENFGFFRDRYEENRGNTYLEPLFGVDKRNGEWFIFPNWDCRPSNGPTKPDANAPMRPPPANTGHVGCYVQGPMNHWRPQPGEKPSRGDPNYRFPHLTARDYQKNDEQPEE